jgi:hypothetical protein
MEVDGVREFAFLSAMQRLLEPNGQDIAGSKLPCRKSSESCSSESEDQSQAESYDTAQYETDDSGEEGIDRSFSSEAQEEEAAWGGIPLGGFHDVFGDRFRPVPVKENITEMGIIGDIDPINKFIESKSVIVAAFLTVFLFRMAYVVAFGKLNTRQRDHLFHQYTRIPSTNR